MELVLTQEEWCQTLPTHVQSEVSEYDAHGNLEGLGRNFGTEPRAEDGTGDTTEKHFEDQSVIDLAEDDMDAAADEAEGHAEEEVCADDGGGGQDGLIHEQEAS